MFDEDLINALDRFLESSTLHNEFLCNVDEMIAQKYYKSEINLK